MPRLVMMSGLPGSGKSTLAKRLSERTGAELLRIDVFEQALRDTHGPGFEVGALGYRHGYDLAAEHLRAGRDVIADAVNAVEAARYGWRKAAEAADAGIVEVEILCSDPEEHRSRLETRETGIAGLAPVSLETAISRTWETNPRADIHLDTAGLTIEQSLSELLRRLPNGA